MESSTQRIVIVGAGHGGSALVLGLRKAGWRGAITLVGDEPVLPYQRPPLSKEWLQGRVELDSLLLRPARFYEDQNIQLCLGQRAVRIDTAANELVLADGRRLPYDHLVLATGADARPLPLPGGDLPQLMTLRNLGDAERLRAALGPGRRLLIIGGGYVGLECAATARSLGAEVTVLEREPRLLARVASAELATELHVAHVAQGVRIELDVQVRAVRRSSAQDEAVEVLTADGRHFPADVVLVGIGASPCVALARDAGLACDDGILVDADGRSSHPNIWALGDVARRPHPLYEKPLRLESVPGANDQAKRVAASLCGRPPATAELPWFWSDQYDLKLQMAGLPDGATAVVARRDPAVPAKLALFHLREGRVVTVEAVNAAAEFIAGRKLIASGQAVDAARLADPLVPMAALMA